MTPHSSGASTAQASPGIPLPRFALALAAIALLAIALRSPGASVTAIAAALVLLGVAAILAHHASVRDRTGRDVESQDMRARLKQASAALVQSHVELEALRAELGEANRHFELALQGSHDGVWEYDLRTQQLYMSPDFRERLGIVLDEQSNGPLAWFESHLHRDDLSRWQSAVKEHLEQRASYSLDLRLRTPEGNYRWFRARGSAEWDLSGRPSRMSGSLTDTTERRFAEARVRESEESFRSLSAASPVGIIKTDALGQCDYCNLRWQEIAGLSDFEAMGEGWLEAVFPEDRDEVLSRWTTFVAAGGTFETRFRVVPPGGPTRWVSSRANPVIDEQGDPSGFVLTFEDVTGEQEAAIALADARDKAMQAAQVKSEFLANMSHEIRTPLNGVVGMAQLLANTRLTDEQHDYVRTINTSADALLSIINDILDFSKIEAGKMQIESVPFSLRTVYEDVAELLAPRARERGLELVLGVEPALPRRLVGDPTRIRQVLINLVSNAIKFTDEGEIVLSAAAVAMGARAHVVKLAVRDTGIGISAERLGAVFESFTQADGSTTRKYGGTGLGLTICRQLAELMGGSIHVASEPGYGSEFWIEIPLAPARGEEVSDLPCDLSGARILVVEGHPVNRSILLETLRAWGANAEVAGDGPDALTRVRDAAGGSFDAVLVDHREPGLNGLQVARRLRELPGAVRRVVFVMSCIARPDGAEAEIGEGRSIEAWLTRPIREATLARALGRALGRGDTQAPAIAPADSHEDFARLNLLLVDDNEVNRKVAARMLYKLGASASIAVNGAEAVRRIMDQEFDLVFMDCQMPEMDGFEATRVVRTHEAMNGGHVRIVAMTANAMEGDREQCLASGMDDYVAKPVKLEALAEQLRIALAARTERDDLAA